jgi:hypothetical protein
MKEFLRVQMKHLLFVGIAYGRRFYYFYNLFIGFCGEIRSSINMIHLLSPFEKNFYSARNRQCLSLKALILTPWDTA